MRKTLLLLPALLLAGCVSAGEHERLRIELRDLSAENASLRERAEALDEDLAREKSLRAQEADALRSQIALLEVDKEKTVETLERKVEEKKVELVETSDAFERMKRALQREIEAGKIDVTEVAGRLRVRMSDRILFPSGSADLSKEGAGVLRRVALTLKETTDKVVQVEGHTDDRSIRSARFPSNWELSAGRACTVVRYLGENGVDKRRLVAAGFGEFQPVRSNKTAEGRQANRRIEIALVAPDPEKVLKEATGRKAEEPAAAPAP